MTLVSHNHKFVYLKTHKTASTSVEMVLEPMCAPPGWEVTPFRHETNTRHGIIGRRNGGKAIPFRWYNWRDHMAAKDCRKALGRDRWDRYAKIATIRNPFDRALSSYFWNLRNEPEKKLTTSEQIADFRRSIAAAKPARPDHEIVHIGETYVVDHTIRYEHLGEDLEALAKTLQLPIKKEDLPRANPSANTKRSIPMADFYDNKTADIVRTRMAWVFDRFPYSLSVDDNAPTNEVPS